MTDLVTVYEYKDAEGMRGEKDDDRLNVIVPQVSDLVKNIVVQHLSITLVLIR